MSSDKNYNIIVNVKGAKEATADISKLGGQAEKSANKITDSFTNIGGKGSSAIGGIGSSLSAMINPVTLAAGAVSAFMIKAIQESANAEASVLKLSNSLKRVGDTSKETLDDVLGWADALEKVTTNSAEAYQDQYSYARSLGFTSAESKKLVEVSADLAAATGDSVESSMTRLIQTTNGLKAGFQKTIPGFEDLSKEALKAGAGVEKIATLFGGAAQEKANTFSGKMTQLGVRVGDIVEKFGDLVVKSPKLTTAFDNIITILAAMPDVFDKVSDRIRKFNPLIGYTAEVLGYTLGKWAEWATPDSADKAKVKSLNNVKDAVAELNNDLEWLDFEKKAGSKTDAEVKKETIELNQKIAEQNGLLNTQKKELQDIRKEKEKKDKNNTVVTGSGGGLSDEEKAALKQAQAETLAAQKATEQANLQAQRGYQAEYEALQKGRVDLETKTNNEIINSKLAYFAQSDEETRANRDLFTEQEATDNQLMLETYTAQDAQRLMQLQQAMLAETDVEKQKTLAKQYEVEQRMALSRKEVEVEKQMSALRWSTANAAVSAGLAFAKKGSKEQKNLMRAQVIMSTYTAASQALAAPPGPPWTIPLAAMITMQGLGNLRQIDQQQFATGGIFNAGGTSINGDKVNARLNDREMILNMQQQRNVFDAINSGSIGQGGLAVDAILSVRDAIMTQNDRPLNLDGQKLNNRLTELNSRNLGA